MTPTDREKNALRREFAHERFGFVQLHASLAQTYLEIGDDAALVYTTRKLITELKSGLGCIKEIEEERLKAQAAAE